MMMELFRSQDFAHLNAREPAAGMAMFMRRKPAMMGILKVVMGVPKTV